MRRWPLPHPLLRSEGVKAENNN
jgi:hypothetical protein